jgi:hypothetical protein
MSIAFVFLLWSHVVPRSIFDTKFTLPYFSKPDSLLLQYFYNFLLWSFILDYSLFSTLRGIWVYKTTEYSITVCFFCQKHSVSRAKAGRFWLTEVFMKLISNNATLLQFLIPRTEYRRDNIITVHK